MAPNPFTVRPRTLDRVNLQITYAQAAGVLYTTLTAQGACDRRRGFLWTYEDTWQTVGGPHALGDRVQLLTSAIDHKGPVNQAEFDRFIVGDMWDQPTLPLQLP